MMRIATVTLGLLLFSGIPTASAQQYRFGPKIGPTIATIRDESAGKGQPYERRLSLEGGGFVVVPLRGPVALQLEGLYTPKGAGLPAETNITDRLLLDYFEVPVLGRITVSRTSSLAWHVFGGPSAGLRVNAKHELAYTGGSIKSGLSENIGADIARFELGIIGGGGLEVGRNFIIDARYFWGLTNVYKDPAMGNLRNRAVTVLAGFQFWR